MDDPELGTLRLPGIGPSFSATPPSIRRIAPRLGEHSAEVLTEVGYSEAEISSMIERGVTSVPDAGA